MGSPTSGIFILEGSLPHENVILERVAYPMKQECFPVEFMGGWTPFEKSKNRCKIQKCSEIGLYVSYRPLDWTILHEILRRKRWWYSQDPKISKIKVYEESENRDFMGGTLPHGATGRYSNTILHMSIYKVLSSSGETPRAIPHGDTPTVWYLALG